MKNGLYLFLALLITISLSGATVATFEDHDKLQKILLADFQDQSKSQQPETPTNKECTNPISCFKPY